MKTLFPTAGKTIALLLLAASSAFGEMDTNVVAISDWSEPVETFSGDTLRTRLVILQGHGAGDASALLSTLVYLELKNCGLSSTEIYFDPALLKSDLHNANGEPVPRHGHGFSGGCPGSGWFTLPRDSLVRLRANCFGIRSPKEGGLAVAISQMDYWFIGANDTNSYFLSATFTVNPPADRMTKVITNMHVWSGTLTIPKTKISLKSGNANK